VRKRGGSGNRGGTAALGRKRCRVSSAAVLVEFAKSKLFYPLLRFTCDMTCTPIPPIGRCFVKRTGECLHTPSRNRVSLKSTTGIVHHMGYVIHDQADWRM
jgi:hypothetical protein